MKKSRDIVSVSPMSGCDMLKGETSLDMFVLVQILSKANLFMANIQNIRMTTFEKLEGNENIKDIICQNSEFINTDLPVLTIKPGINLSATGDAVGQTYII